MGVMPDIVNRASILGFFRMDPRLLLAGMTEGERDPRHQTAGMEKLQLRCPPMPMVAGEGPTTAGMTTDM